MDKKVEVTLNGNLIECTLGTNIQELLAAHFDELKAETLAVKVGGAVKGLRWQPSYNCAATLLSYDDEEARRVYERSARYVFLMAVSELLPQAHVRIEHSVSNGVYAEMMGGVELNAQRVRHIEERMREIVEQDLPFIRTRLSRQEAIDYFKEKGQDDTVRLLAYRPYDYFDLYTCGEHSDYFYGEMLPSTGYVRYFKLQFYLPGVVLQLPSQGNFGMPVPFLERPKLLRTFAQTSKENAILQCNNAADLNDLIAQGKIRDFIRVSEALQEKTIAGIAGEIMSRGSRLVLIAGPSSSGKTTFTNRLAVQLRTDALRPVSISLDNYYKNRDEVPLGENGKPDLECLEALDVDLFNENLVALLQGEEVELPIFSFEKSRRLEQGTKLRVGHDQPILVEGIHGLNTRLTQDIPSEMKFKVYVSALTQLNLDDHNRIRTTDVRLLRRIVRDHQFRGTKVEKTLEMWDEVRRGEEKFIFPFQEEADIMFNSSLAYELAVLKRYAYPLLQSVTERCPYYTRAHRMQKFLNYFLITDLEEEIPPTSILREFIGGCTFYA